MGQTDQSSKSAWILPVALFMSLHLINPSFLQNRSSHNFIGFIGFVFLQNRSCSFIGLILALELHRVPVKTESIVSCEVFSISGPLQNWLIETMKQSSAVVITIAIITFLIMYFQAKRRVCKNFHSTFFL